MPCYGSLDAHATPFSHNATSIPVQSMLLLELLREHTRIVVMGRLSSHHGLGLALREEYVKP